MSHQKPDNLKKHAACWRIFTPLPHKRGFCGQKLEQLLYIIIWLLVYTRTHTYIHTYIHTHTHTHTHTHERTTTQALASLPWPPALDATKGSSEQARQEGEGRHARQGALLVIDHVTKHHCALDH